MLKIKCLNLIVADASTKIEGAIPAKFVGVVLARAQGNADIISHSLENILGRLLITLKYFLQKVTSKFSY